MIHALDRQDTCGTAISRSGTTLEHDPQHRPTLCHRQLYLFDTLFGQQGTEAKRGYSVNFGDL
jgi:hypothetical protein